MPSVITIKRLTGQNVQMPFDPNEPIWSFSIRIELLLPYGFLSWENTGRYMVVFRGKMVNSFDNRLLPVGNIITEKNPSVYASDWKFSGKLIFMYGNLSPNGGCDRSVCAICLENILEVSNGPLSNPLIPKVLKCGHAFHTGCIKQVVDKRCPICRR